MSQEQVNEFVIYGTPEDVLRQIRLLEEAGIPYFIIDLDPSKELKALEMFANEIHQPIGIISVLCVTVFIGLISGIYRESLRVSL